METIRVLTELEKVLPRHVTSIALDYLFPKPALFRWSLFEHVLNIQIDGPMELALLIGVSDPNESAQCALKNIQEAKDTELVFYDGEMTKLYLFASFSENVIRFYSPHAVATVELDPNLQTLIQLAEALRLYKEEEEEEE